MELCSQSLRNILEVKPQIIHRDLKPDNILITKNVRNGRFIKLCDFGLATVHEKRIHYITKHKHTADVGDTRRQRYSTTFPILNAPVFQMQKVLVSMITTNWTERPECREVLHKYNEWSIDRNIILENNSDISSQTWNLMVKHAFNS
ncbi:unnamed protein product [Oppiella nova]|uniref:Protein kinase domain-containing protein n=1 Tax=Oppiella nova TaxID=334625 RepID=A0A7R9M8X4_9ACAR|nr:unnamed protein product [Oppiella nova]CAG2172808.1 unnamed protein product [Oppiella nova]